ncbi:MAG: pyroglutamyl-peptidase I [Dermatophilaceae bacterium]
MSVLVTGFGAFGNVALNPSERIARDLDGQQIAGTVIRAMVLPVASEQVQSDLAAAIERTRPQLIVVLGVAPGRTAVALERVAVNVKDFPLPDIDGHAPVDEPVLPDGPAAYLTNLPVKAILRRWAREDVPGYLSNTAGTYVCNQVFYLACHYARELSIPAGLIHLPSTPQSVTGAALRGQAPPSTADLATLTLAVHLAIEVALTHQGSDLRAAAGALS